MNLYDSVLMSFVWRRIRRFFPKNSRFACRTDYRFKMTALGRTDPSAYRIENAKRTGAKIGRNCKLYSLNIISEPYLLEIGDNVIVSVQVTFVTHDQSVLMFTDEMRDIVGHYGRIKIGSNCFIGLGTIILPNVEIGEGCIIGAGSVVTKSFPAGSVIAGNPAGIIYDTTSFMDKKLGSPYTIFDGKHRYPEKMTMLEEKELVIRNLNSIKKRQWK